MVYTPPVYPTSIPLQTGTAADLPDRIDDLDWLYAARYNELKKELCAIMTELGTLPKGSFSDVKTRLAALVENPMTDPGDIIVGGTAGAPERLGIGAAGLKLFVNAAANGFNFSTGFKLISLQRDISLAAEVIAYTGVGFKPSACIIFSIINTSPLYSFGFSDLTNDYCLYSLPSSGSDYMSSSNANCIFLVTSPGNIQYADIDSFDSDGLSINWKRWGTPTQYTAEVYLLVLR